MSTFILLLLSTLFILTSILYILSPNALTCLWYILLSLYVTGIDPITIRRSSFQARYSHSLARDEVEWKGEELKSVFDSIARQETQLAVLGTVVWVLYTVQDFWNVLHYDAMRKVLESYGNYYGRLWNIVEDHPELDGKVGKLVEATRIVQDLGSVSPHSYPCRHVRPRDLWCELYPQRKSFSVDITTCCLSPN